MNVFENADCFDVRANRVSRKFYCYEATRMADAEVKAILDKLATALEAARVELFAPSSTSRITENLKPGRKSQRLA